MDKDSFIVYIRTDDIYRDIAEHIETTFGTSNYELERSLLKEKRKTLIGLMKDELGGKTITRPAVLRAKSYSYLIDVCSEDKNGKGTKKCVIKRKLKFEDYKNCLELTPLEKKTKWKRYNFTDQTNVIGSSWIDD